MDKNKFQKEYRLNDVNRISWIVRYLPAPVVRYFKRVLPLQVKLSIRSLLGNSVESIPIGVVQVADGRRFNVGPNIGYWSIYYTNDYEPECSAVLRYLIQPDDVVLDIGANIGWYSTLFATLVGTRGRVIAVEPVPSTYAALCANVAMNDMGSTIEAHKLALGDQSGEVDIYSFPHELGTDSISTLGRSAYTKNSVAITRLDEFLSEHQITRVNLVKCDVEGAEMAVLNGGSSLFSSPEAPLLLIELNDETGSYFGFQRADILGRLRQFGYKNFFAILSFGSFKLVRDDEDLIGINMLLAEKSPVVMGRLFANSWNLKPESVFSRIRNKNNGSTFL